MKITLIATDPDPYQPYRLAQGYRVGDMLYISGQAALDDAGALVGIGDFDAQAERTFANLARVLQAGGSSLANVVKVTIFLRDMAQLPKIVELRGRYFTPPYPADTIVEVSSLSPRSPTSETRPERHARRTGPPQASSPPPRGKPRSAKG
eukprot:gene19041-26977_t